MLQIVRRVALLPALTLTVKQVYSFTLSDTYSISLAAVSVLQSYSLKCLFCSVQFAVCSVQGAVCSVQCAVFSLQCSVRSLQCGVCSAESCKKLFLIIMQNYSCFRPSAN